MHQFFSCNICQKSRFGSEAALSSHRRHCISRTTNSHTPNSQNPVCDAYDDLGNCSSPEVHCNSEVNVHLEDWIVESICPASVQDIMKATDEFRWPNERMRIVSHILSLFNSSESQGAQCLELLHQLLIAEGSLPSTIDEVRRVEKVILEDAHLQTTKLNICIPKTSSGRSMVHLPSDSIDVVHKPLLCCVEDILNDDDIANQMMWTACAEGRGELLGGDWFKNLKDKYSGKQILVIIAYADATSFTFAGKSLHPVYVTVGNLPLRVRNKLNAKRLLGFIPSISVLQCYKQSKETQRFKREVHNLSLRVMLQELLDLQDGWMVTRKRANQGWFCVPRLAYIIADHPEAQQLCRMYTTSNVNRPCRMCLVQPKVEGISVCGSPRHKDDMIQLVSMGMTQEQEQEFSMHGEDNYLWDIPDYDVFMTPVCRMHATDHGILVKILDLCVSIVKKQRVRSVFDTRWKSVGSFPGMKVFHTGVSTLKFVTATEHRMIASCLPFIVHELCAESPQMEETATLYCKWRKLLEKEEYFDHDLRVLDVLGNLLIESIINLAAMVTTDPVLNIKVHFIRHWSSIIRTFGATANYNSETFESAHKEFVKPYRGKVTSQIHNAGKGVMSRDALAAIHQRNDNSMNAGERKAKRRRTRGKKLASALQLSEIPQQHRHQLQGIVSSLQSALCGTAGWLQRGHCVNFIGDGENHFGKITGIYSDDDGVHATIAPFRFVEPLHFLPKNMVYAVYQSLELTSTIKLVPVSAIQGAVHIATDFGASNRYLLNEYFHV
jgi:hypothetical protein